MVSFKRHKQGPYKRVFGVSKKVKALLGVISLCLGFAFPNVSFADQLGLNTLAPPRSKFKLPNLGDISIWKNDMQKAKIAYRKRKFNKARKHLHKALNSGNFIAGWYLGHIHRLGLGVPVNRGKAFKFYRQVALEYDDSAVRPRVFMITLDSLVRVADGYRTGLKKAGLKRNYARAKRLYVKAANRGHPAAQFGLGRMYLGGQGTKKNISLGLRWINFSARKNYPPALALLGELYWKGKYVKKRRSRALMMYIVATKNTNEALHPQIFDRLDQLYNKANQNTASKAEQLAQEWLKRYPAHPSRFSQAKRKPAITTGGFIKSVGGGN